MNLKKINDLATKDDKWLKEAKKRKSMANVGARIATKQYKEMLLDILNSKGVVDKDDIENCFSSIYETIKVKNIF